MKSADFEKLLLDEATDAMVVMTPDGKATYWNRGASHLFGYTSEYAKRLKVLRDAKFAEISS